MKILTNKFFILGNLLLLLISIPLTLFFVSKQQELRGRAAPSSRLYFNPESPSSSTQCTSGFTIDVMVDPGSNMVSIVDFYIKYDPTKLDVLQIKESDKFPNVWRPASVSSGQADMSVNTGIDLTKAVQTPTKVATITFRPKVQGNVQISFDAEKSQVHSVAPSDPEPTENVLFQVTPANVTIGTGACTTGPTATPTTGAISTPTLTVTPTTQALNQSPLCTELAVAPSATGSAPFSVLFTAKGNDPDTAGTLKKVTFNFGDGQTQDVTEGLSQKSATIQANHTYQAAGTFGATAIFTDNAGAISNACSKTITATASGSGTITPTPTGSQSAQVTPTTAPTVAPTSIPTIPPTGDIAKTIGIVGVVILTIVGGFALLAL